MNSIFISKSYQLPSLYTNIGKKSVPSQFVIIPFMSQKGHFPILHSISFNSMHEKEIKQQIIGEIFQW